MKLRARRKATAKLSAEQLRVAFGQLTEQARPQRRWPSAARSAAWRARWWLTPLAAMGAAWVVGAVIAATAVGWFPVLLLSAAAVAGSVLLARPLPESDRPWVSVPTVFVAAYWVATAILG